MKSLAMQRATARSAVCMTAHTVGCPIVRPQDTGNNRLTANMPTVGEAPRVAPPPTMTLHGVGEDIGSAERPWHRKEEAIPLRNRN